MHCTSPRGDPEYALNYCAVSHRRRRRLWLVRWQSSGKRWRAKPHAATMTMSRKLTMMSKPMDLR